MVDKELHISIGSSRWSTSWPTSVIRWSEFCERLRTPIRGTETLGEFLKMSKADQDNRKDVGGFVGGVVEGGNRKVTNVKSRDLITLDLDNIPAGQTQTVLVSVQNLTCAAAVYSTRKHRPAAPRLRVIIPTDRTMSVDEYEPVCRRMAKLLGISYCDPTTFDLNRLMFWPSVSSDSEYIYEVYDQDFIKVDSILSMYGDWTDASQWPTVEGEKALQKRLIAKQQDPTTKAGVVGAFCRTYTIREAMEKFIPGMYTQAQSEDRYTYTGGSTSGGAIIYDGDRWMYSHHATDPCSGQLVNAFDMVRLHKFAEADSEAKTGTPATRLPSYKLMQELALKDTAVSRLMAKERQESAAEAFTGIAAKRVKLSDQVTAIGARAFANCPNLVGIYIPGDCNSIAATAFSGVIWGWTWSFTVTAGARPQAPRQETVSTVNRAFSVVGRSLLTPSSLYRASRIGADFLT